MSNSDSITLKLQGYQVEAIVKTLVASGSFIYATLLLKQAHGFSIKQAQSYYKTLPEYAQGLEALERGEL